MPPKASGKTSNGDRIVTIDQARPWLAETAALISWRIKKASMKKTAFRRRSNPIFSAGVFNRMHITTIARMRILLTTGMSGGKKSAAKKPAVSQYSKPSFAVSGRSSGLPRNPAHMPAIMQFPSHSAGPPAGHFCFEEWAECPGDFHLEGSLQRSLAITLSLTAKYVPGFCDECRTQLPSGLRHALTVATVVVESANAMLRSAGACGV